MVVTRMQNLTGHVRRLEDKPRAKCRKWKLVVNLPAEDGSYPKRTDTFRGTYREALAALEEFKMAVASELDSTETGMTFSEYAGAWHNARVKSRAFAARTMDRETYRIKGLSLHLGDMKMTEITTSDIEKCYSKLRRGKSLTGKALSAGTIASYHVTLKTMFSDAERDGDIRSSPAKHVKIQKVPQSDRRIPTTAEVDELVSKLDLSDARHMALLIIATCGLRVSEAVMLDIDRDYDGTKITVREASDDDGEPKSTKNLSIREVPCPEVTREALDAWPHDGRICPVLPHSMTSWWSKVRDGYGMEGVTLHGFRHAYATRLAEAGVHPRTMMQLGGWKTIDVCMRIYTHVNSSELFTAVERAFS